MSKTENNMSTKDVAIVNSGEQPFILHSGEILVICKEAKGFRRAGINHNPIEIYTDLTLTSEQLKMLESDPAFVVVRAV